MSTESTTIARWEPVAMVGASRLLSRPTLLAPGIGADAGLLFVVCPPLTRFLQNRAINQYLDGIATFEEHTGAKAGTR